MTVSAQLHWGKDRLKDISEINGRSLGADTPDDYEFDYLEISNVDYHGVVSNEAIERIRFADAPSRARRRVRCRDVLVSSVRPNLQAIAHNNGNGSAELICSTGFNVVSPAPNKVHDRFLYYFLLSEGTRQRFEAVAKGVGYPALDDKDFAVTSIPLPPSGEQERIATYLDASCTALDRAVDLKREQRDTLVALRRSMISKAVLLGVQGKRPLRKIASPWLKTIPKAWKLVSLKRVSETQSGITLGKNYDGHLVERPYLRAANVQDGYLDLSKITTIELPADLAPRYELRPGDVLMTEGGDLDKLGRGFVWNGEIEGCLHQNHVFAIRTFPRLLNPEFLAYLTTSQFGRDYFEATGKRTTNLASTNSTKVGLMPVPLPPIAEQREIVAELDSGTKGLRDIEAVISEQIDTLVAYRKSLIHECVTGKRRITDADVAEVQAHV